MDHLARLVQSDLYVALVDIDAAYRLSEMEEYEATRRGVFADQPRAFEVSVTQPEQVLAGSKKTLGDLDRIVRRGGPERFDRIGQRLRQPERIDA